MINFRHSFVNYYYFYFISIILDWGDAIIRHDEF